jgi:hypothetical protein
MPEAAPDVTGGDAGESISECACSASIVRAAKLRSSRWTFAMTMKNRNRLISQALAGIVVVSRYG